MNIQKAVKLIGPLKLNDDLLGCIVVDLVNASIPTPLHLSKDLTGYEALNRINDFPSIYRSTVINKLIPEQNISMNKIIRSIKHKKQMAGFVDGDRYRTMIVISSIIFICIALLMVMTYMQTSLSNGDSTDTTFLSMLFELLLETFEQTE